MLMTALAIAPAAFLMGMPFPSGLRRLEERHSPSVRWAWSLNAAASVLGSGGSDRAGDLHGPAGDAFVRRRVVSAALLVILATRRRTASN